MSILKLPPVPELDNVKVAPFFVNDTEEGFELSVRALTPPMIRNIKNAPNTNKPNVLFSMCNHFAVTMIYKYLYGIKIILEKVEN